MQANENIQQSQPVTLIQYDFIPTTLFLNMQLLFSPCIHLQIESFKLKSKNIKPF